MLSQLSNSISAVRTLVGSHFAGTWRRAPRAALTALALLPISCAGNGPAGDEPADRDQEEIASNAQAITPPFPIDPRKSLLVTDTDIVSAFTLKDVLQQLVDQAGVPGLTPLLLFHQLFDTYRQGANGLGLGPNCDDAPISGSAGSINGWPIDCPRLVGDEATRDPFADPPDDASYMATTLANRFDLAPPDGSDCGQYRVVFARRSGIPVSGGLTRNFIIFEGYLPNPNVSLGREGCRPVVELWQGLSDPAKSPQDRASELHDFYFQGLPGFSPVIHIDHYGQNGGANDGQIRTNEFMFPQAAVGTWNLREFRLTHGCTGGACSLLAVPNLVKDNPAAPLFDPTSTDARAASFQGTYFPGAVERLASGDINRFFFPAGVPDVYNAGESQMIGNQNDYPVAFGSGASTFRSRIQQELTASGSTLTPDQIVNRAQALSCSGCHEPQAHARDVGFSTPWPATLVFTHTSEKTEVITGDPTRERFLISPALKDVFLPFRLQVMNDFLVGNPVLGFESAGAWTSTQASLSRATSWVTEGLTSLRVGTSSSWNEITSANFSTAGSTPVGNKLALDVFVSPIQPNSAWIGTVEVLISIPSAGISNQWVGNAVLNNLPLGAFSTVELPLQAATVTALNGAPSDVSLRLILSVTSGSGPYFLDNVRFKN